MPATPAQAAELNPDALRDLYEACNLALIGAKHESCAFGPDDPDPTFHCCDWNEVVTKLEAALAKAEART